MSMYAYDSFFLVCVSMYPFTYALDSARIGLDHKQIPDPNPSLYSIHIFRWSRGGKSTTIITPRNIDKVHILVGKLHNRSTLPNIVRGDKSTIRITHRDRNRYTY